MYGIFCMLVNIYQYGNILPRYIPQCWVIWLGELYTNFYELLIKDVLLLTVKEFTSK